VAAVAAATRAAHVEIEEHIPADLPQALGDAAAIQQAVVNLLTNANKYAASGRWIGVSVGNGKAGELEVRVEDRGPGIPAGELKRIFEPFCRGSAAANRSSRGAGLGLTIAQQIARAHGGRVTVVSAPGRGSCFTLHLPTI
jgi:signal transduction histidine kinase